MQTIRLLWVLLLAMAAHVSKAQITFQKAYTDTTSGDLISLQQTTDGGFIAMYSNYDDLDILLVKLDQYGDVSWNRTYGGAGQDVGVDVRQTSDGGYILCGYTNSFGADPTTYAIKTDTAGNIIWSKIYGGKSYGSQIQQTYDGGYIICALMDSDIVISNLDLGLIKIDSSGNLEWAKRYFVHYAETAPGLMQTIDGGFIIGCRSVFIPVCGNKDRFNKIPQYNSCTGFTDLIRLEV